MSSTNNPHHNPDTTGEGSILVEIVDRGGPLTPEKLNRPRYRRPVRPPAGQPGTFFEGTLVEFTDDGSPPAPGGSTPPRDGGPADEPPGPAAPVSR